MASNWRRFIEVGDVRRDVEELKDLTFRYVKEETVDPVKELGRFAAFGCLGSLFIGFGTVMLLIGALRILQSETGTFHGNLSWVPYLIVVMIGLTVMGLTGWKIVSGPARRRMSKSEKSS